VEKEKDQLHIEASKHILALGDWEKESATAISVVRSCMNAMDASLSPC
jgi:hypothetical protein